MEFELGNNINCISTYKIKIPLYNANSLGEPGVKYFFPEIPNIDKKIIVGIDANLSNDSILLDPPPIQYGDQNAPVNLLIPNFDNQVRINQAQKIFCTMYDDQDSEKFYNIPLRSFFMLSGSLFFPTNKPRRVKPYSGKIQTRKSYLFIPVGVTDFIGLRYYVNLTFYIN